MIVTDKTGGAEEIRTPDLRIANATLSQLSYGPTAANRPNCNIPRWRGTSLLGLERAGVMMLRHPRDQVP
jgi:hypothetical protein